MLVKETSCHRQTGLQGLRNKFQRSMTHKKLNNQKMSISSKFKGRNLYQRVVEQVKAEKNWGKKL